MVTTKFYLDCRRLRADGTAPLKIAVQVNRVVRYVATGVCVAPDEWDAADARVRSTNRMYRSLNARIGSVEFSVEAAVGELEAGSADVLLSMDDYLRAIRCRLSGDGVVKVVAPAKPARNNFARRLTDFALRKAAGTRRLYMCTLSRMRAFDADVDALTFEDITRDWLLRFEAWMRDRGLKKNASNIHLRNIRAVFNDALDDEVITCYPFRRLKIRPEPTRKRSLSVERLRELFAAEVEPYARQYLDMFKLSFMLCGINTVDLCHLEAVVDGRVEYKRAKTGRLYSVKVEPEALEIINRYRGRRQLLDMMDRYNNHAYFTQHINKALQRIGTMERRGRGGKKYFEPLCPGITTYWARHTWATIAASLDIPKETIAAGLGHGGNTVTDIYIDFDRRKVDEANRRVLDWVLYGLRP